jgi:hypothetical protein
MSAETNEPRVSEPPKIPALPPGLAQLPPPSPTTGGRVPPLSTLISQGAPGRRSLARPAAPPAGRESDRVPTIPVKPAVTPRPGIPEAPRNGEHYTTFKEAIAANEAGSVFNMPPLPVRESSAVPTPTKSVEQASQPGDYAQLFREAAGEAVAEPVPAAAPALPPGMPTPPPPRRAPASSAPLNAEDIQPSKIDPAELLKPSRRSHQSPYRGLQRFDAEDVPQYCGPRQLLVNILDALEETSLLCLTGPPASGKSSLLRAGVAPNWQELEGEASRAFVFTPGDDPFTELSHALLAAGCSEELAAVAREPAHYVFRRIENFLEPNERWMIVVDQFEEAGRGMVEAEIPRDAAFMSSLVELSRRPESRVKVILALRDDFFWKLGHYPELAEAADHHLFRLTDLTEKELQQAITLPARAQGVEIENELLLHILKDLPDQRPSLPLLQHVLDVLWIARTPDQKRLRLDDYLVLGGLNGALRRRLETIYSGLSAAGKGALRQALLRLVDVSGMSMESRGPGLALPYRMALEDFTETREREALEMLVAARLLMCRVGPRTIVELPVPVYLQAWPRFRRWIQEINEAVALRNQLEEDAGRWKFNTGRKGEAAGAKDLWRGGHLEWAIELRERGDFDSLLGGLTRDEDAFLDASRAADTPRVAAPAPAPASPEPAPQEAAPVEEKQITAVKAVPLNPNTPAGDNRKLTGQFYISKEEAAEREKVVGGPSLKQKVEDPELKNAVQNMELQHELVVREKRIKQLMMVLGVMAGLLLILFVLAMKGCMASAAANVRLELPAGSPVVAAAFPPTES